MPEMGDAGFVTGVVFGAATALAFLLACLYSAYKAIVDRRRILRKNENIRAQRVEEAADMVGEPEPVVQNQHTAAVNGTAGASTSPTGATSSTSLTMPAQEERRPSAAFKPPPPPPEKQWEQQGVHYRSEGGVMHIHKSDSSKLSVGPGDEAEKEPLMSAPDPDAEADADADADAGESSENKAEEVVNNSDDETEEAAETKTETETEENPVDPAAPAQTTTTTTTTTSETTTTESSETTAQVHVTVSVSENQDGQVITSTSTEALKQLDSSSTVESGASGSTKVHKLYTSSTGDGTRTQTGTDLPDVTNGDPAAWV